MAVPHGVRMAALVQNAYYAAVCVQLYLTRRRYCGLLWAAGGCLGAALVLALHPQHDLVLYAGLAAAVATYCVSLLAFALRPGVWNASLPLKLAAALILAASLVAAYGGLYLAAP